MDRLSSKWAQAAIPQRMANQRKKGQSVRPPDRANKLHEFEKGAATH
jgi:hypothetical protein